MRDLCRARQAAVRDRRRARQRQSSFLLRHSEVWRGGDAWTVRHEAWLASRRFQDPAVARAYVFYRGEVIARDATVEAMEAELGSWFDRPLFAETVGRLGAYRGIDQLGALVLVMEVCDWRRFTTAAQFMGFSGLTASEFSSGSAPGGATSPTPATCTYVPSWLSAHGQGPRRTLRGLRDLRGDGHAPPRSRSSGHRRRPESPPGTTGRSCLATGPPPSGRM